MSETTTEHRCTEACRPSEDDARAFVLAFVREHRKRSFRLHERGDLRLLLCPDGETGWAVWWKPADEAPTRVRLEFMENTTSYVHPPCEDARGMMIEDYGL